MKKVLLFLNIVLFIFLCSCFSRNPLNNYFSKDVLKKFLVSDLVNPVDATDVEPVGKEGDRITYVTTREGFNKNVSNVYEYLKEKDFLLGRRGEVLTSFLIPIYAFYECDSLLDYRAISNGLFWDDCYRFVYGTGLNERNMVQNAKTLVLQYIEDDNKVYMYFEDYIYLAFEYISNVGYTLGMFFPWLININNVESIKCEYIKEGVKYITISNDRLDISTVVYREDIVRVYDGKIDSEWIINYIYLMPDGTSYEINIVDGYLLIDGVYYVLDEGLIDSQLRKYHYKSTTILDDTVYAVYECNHSSNNGPKIREISLKNMTYIPIGTSDLSEEVYYFKYDDERVYIYSENIFKMHGSYYEVISEENFKSLFEEFE